MSSLVYQSSARFFFALGGLAAFLRNLRWAPCAAAETAGTANPRLTSDSQPRRSAFW